MELRYTLLADGSSDNSLMPVLTWVMEQVAADYAIVPRWADFRHLIRPPRDLQSRLQLAVGLYPCDLLFAHRDAEAQAPSMRVEEIRRAVIAMGPTWRTPVIPVVPVRMTEAWLLFDERAIRRAASNPNGTNPLKLPHISKIEAAPDPKDILHSTLREACGLRGARRKKFDARAASRLVATYIDDFRELRRLAAFNSLETAVREAVREYREAVGP